MTPARIILLGFFSLVIFGSILLALPISSSTGTSIGLIDALFTATSAVCVTGLVVLDTGSSFSFFGQFIILLLIQIGGLGIMAFATMFSLMIGRKVNLKERLTLQETVNDISLEGILKLFKYLLIGTFTIELLGAAILSIRFIPRFGLLSGIWKSIFHSISAFCNAGFDVMGTIADPFVSLTQYRSDYMILIVISILFIFGGLGFITWRDIFSKRKFEDYMLHTKVVLVATVVFIIIGFLSIFLLEFNHTMMDMSLADKIVNGFFHGVTPRTAGFNTLDVGSFSQSTHLLTSALMFIGGSTGSTAGGIKITTFVIILFTLLTYLKGSEDVNIFHRKVKWNIVRKSISIVFLAFIIISISIFVLSISGNGTLSEVFFESVSAFGTVGLSTGITPDLTTIGKITIAIVMFIGRVGPLSLAVSLTYTKQKDLLTYPEGKISVG